MATRTVLVQAELFQNMLVSIFLTDFYYTSTAKVFKSMNQDGILS